MNDILEFPEGEDEFKPRKDKEALRRELEDAFKILENYDGFEDLLAPLAENLEVFAPKAAKKKQRFLKDEFATPQKQLLRDQTEAIKNLLVRPDVGNHQQLRTVAQEKLDVNESLVHKNLGKIVESALDLEQTYRELDLFFRNAEPTEVKNLTLLNINKEVLLDVESNTLYNEVKRRLEHEAKKVDQEKAYALLVIPKLWQSTHPKNLIERYAKLAGTTRLQFLTDFADEDSVKEALKTGEHRTWQGVCGAELFHSHLTLFANHVVLRGKKTAIGEEADLRGSPAMLLAGKMYAGKISQPVAGLQYGSVSGAEGIVYDTNQEQVRDLSKLGFNSMMRAYKKDMAYDAKTAFNGSKEDADLKSYAVVRVFDYINRVFRHYLGKVTHEQLSEEKVRKVELQMNSFLNQLAKQDIIKSGEVLASLNEDTPDRIDITVNIVPLWAIRTFVYELKAVKGGHVDIETLK